MENQKSSRVGLPTEIYLKRRFEMKMKIYTILNKRTQVIENIWMAKNDNEAMYFYAIHENKQQLQNPYYRPDDYTLYVLGAIKCDFDEESNDKAGIMYEYANDFPYEIDNIPDNILPKKHDSPSADDTTVVDINRKHEIMRDIANQANKE